MHFVRFYFLVFFVSGLTALSAKADTDPKKIIGTVVDSKSGEPVPFASIYFPVSQTGTTSDFDGKFSIDIPQVSDSMIVSAVGYNRRYFRIRHFLKKEIVIKLEPQNIEIAEIKVRPGRSITDELLKKIHENEHCNNTEYFCGIEGEEYNRTSILFTNIDRKVMDRKVFRYTRDAFIVQSDSSCSVPVLIAEDIHRFLIPPDGGKRLSKRISEKRNALGLFEGADMTDITDEMSANQNFYKPFIPLLGKNFASPLALNARFFYKLWIADSTYVDGVQRLKVEFKPRRKKDLAFVGYFWVEKGSFAITEIKAELSPQANINYIRNIRSHIYYQPLENGRWYFKSKKAEILLDYAPGTDTLDKITTHITKVSSFSKLAASDKFQIEDSLVNVDKDKNRETEEKIFWENHRPIALDSSEQKMAAAIDTLKTNRLVKVFDKSVSMFLTGYWEGKRFDLGPYLDFYRHNKIEGHRFTLAGRTGKGWSENYTFGGYAGYGLKDRKAKYGMDVMINIPFEKYTILGAGFWDDLKLVGNNDNLSFIRENSYSGSEDNIVSSLTARRPNNKLTRKQYASVWLEHDLKKGLSSKLKLMVCKTYPGLFVPFTKDGRLLGGINQFEAGATLRFSFHENHLNEYFRRIYLGNKYPVINMNLAGGLLQLDGKQLFYGRVHSTMKQRLRLGMASLFYVLEAGKIVGKVPYPMLEIHRGNETFGYARFNFNMLNYMEYISDSYVNLHSSLNLGGFFLNSFPLIKRLNLREVVSFKAIVGSLDNKHKKVMDFPRQSGPVANMVYAECGVGLTNIGKYGRLEYVWRLTDRNKPGIMKEGIRFRFEVGF